MTLSDATKETAKQNDGLDMLVCDTIVGGHTLQTVEADPKDKRIFDLEQELGFYKQAYKSFLRSSEIGNHTIGIVHGLGNNLMILQGYLEFLRTVSDDPLLNKYVGECVNATEEIAVKKNAIMNYVKGIKTGKSTTDIFTFLDSRMTLFETVHKDWNFDRVYTKNRPESGKLEICIDTSAVNYAIGTFIDNSVQASKRGSRITVDFVSDLLPKTRKYDDVKPNTHSIRIKDWGKGIPEHIHGKLFVSGGTFGKENGTGTGLAYSRKLLHEAGCDVRFKSKEGHGTTFHIDIPYDNPIIDTESSITPQYN